MDKLNLLALMVALSAYLAAIRLALIQRLGAEPPPTNPRGIKNMLLALIPADMPLVVGGLLLTANLFWTDLLGGAPPAFLYPAAGWLFVAGICILAIHHAVAWVITAKKSL
jgi:hypothetical protein